MKRRILQATLTLAVAASAAGLGLAIHLRFFWELGPIEIAWNLDRPQAIHRVDPAAWAQLRTGMTAAEVRRLLGESHSRVRPAGEPGHEPEPRPAYWEYNWTDGLSLTGPSAKAYVVFFDANDRVASFRAPLVPPAE